MGFFEDSCITAKSILDTAVKKAGDTIDIQKLKIEIAKVQSSIDDDCAELGRFYYNSIKDKNSENGENDEAAAKLVDVIDRKKQALAELKQKLNIMKHTKTCEECGTVNGKEAAYCNGCGKKL